MLAGALPVVVCALSPWSPATGLVYLGVMAGAVALTEGRVVCGVTAVAVPGALVLGELLSGSPPLGAAFVALLGLAVAWSWGRGWPNAATYVAIAGALAVMAAPRMPALTGAPLWQAALTTAAFGLAGGLWVLLLSLVLVPWVTGGPGRPGLTASAPRLTDVATRRRFAVTLAVTAGVSTGVVMAVFPAQDGWWVVLTVLVVVVPDVRTTTARVVDRVLGTVLGALAAAVIVLTVPSARAILALGLVLGLASAAAYLSAPYWVYVSLLTPALVLLTAPPDAAVRTDVRRLVFTAAGAGAVVVVGGLTRLAMSAVARRRH